MKRWLVWLVLIMTVCAACSGQGAGAAMVAPSSAPSSAPTATPSATEEPTPESPLPLSPEMTGCLANADGIVGTGEPCIQGTYEAHTDVTTQVSTHAKEHLLTQLSVTFSLWAVSAGQLEGQAHLTYLLNSTIVDTEATDCQTKTSTIDPFSWDVTLTGQYAQQPNGSIRVFFQATPDQGPALTQGFDDCPLPDQPKPGIIWADLSGELMNGVYDFRLDEPLPANATGQSYIMVHMEQSKRP